MELVVFTHLRPLILVYTSVYLGNSHALKEGPFEVFVGFGSFFT